MCRAPVTQQRDDKTLPPVAQGTKGKASGVTSSQVLGSGLLASFQRCQKRASACFARSSSSTQADSSQLLEMLELVTNMESTYLTRIEPDGDYQHILFSRNTKNMQIPEGLSVPWGDTLCKRALDEGRRYTCDVASIWGDSEAAKALGIMTYVSTPVTLVDGQLALAGRYPARADLARWAGLALGEAKTASDACCSGGSCC